MRSVEIDGRLVHYQVRGQYAVVQGDIIIGAAVAVGAAARQSASKSSEPQSSVLLFNTSSPQQWPNGTMYYAIDSNIPNPQRILDGVAHWNTKTSLKILPRTSEPNYVHFVRSTTLDAACSSFLGMTGGPQAIETTDNCSTGSVIHELGHAWGLLHEQERADRNAFITVLYQNIDKRVVFNFDQRLTSSRDAGYYDYDSIMHYPATGFARNGLDSIETAPLGIPLGQRIALSAGDIDGVERLYGFTPTATTVTTTPAGLSIVVDGVTATGPQSFNWTPGSTHTIAVSSPQGPADPRYVFVRWSDGGDASHTITAAAGQTVFCAVFQAQHKLTAGVGSGAGTVALTPATAADGYYPDRQPVRVSATPATGSQFVRWTGTTALAASANSVSAPNPIVQAQIAGSQYLAAFSTAALTTVDAKPGGVSVIVDGVSYITPARFAFAPGTSHTLDVTAAQTADNNTIHYQFIGWEDGTTGRRSIVTGGADATFTASFGMKYLLTTSAIGPGNVVAAPASEDGYYDAGAAVQLTANPNPGFALRYWLGDASGGTLVQTFTMDQQHDATAYFGAPLTFAVLNAASFIGSPLFYNTGFAVAPGEIVTIFGSNLGPASLTTGQLDASGKLATTLAGTRVFFDGVAAPLIYTSGAQVSAVVPFSVAGKTSTVVRVENNGAVIGNLQITAADTAPALFTANASGKGQIAALNQDSSVNSAANPAAPGSVVVLYATGGGEWTEPVPDGQIMGSHLVGPKAPVFVRVGKLPTQVIYVGSAPFLVNGALQVNVVLPKELIPDLAVPIQLVAGNFASPPGTTIAVK